MRYHLHNGLCMIDFVQRPKDLQKISAFETQFKMQLEKEKMFLETFLKSTKAKETKEDSPSGADADSYVADASKCDEIQKFLDEIIPTLKPVDHPVRKHFENAAKMLAWYRMARSNSSDEEFAKKGNQFVLVEDLKNEWNDIEGFLQKAKENVKLTEQRAD